MIRKDPNPSEVVKPWQVNLSYGIAGVRGLRGAVDADFGDPFS